MASLNLADVTKRLECGICLGMLYNPKQLSCNHTFCKKCIDKILTFSDHDDSATIKCPNQCQEHTYIGPDQTTNDLQISYIVNSLLDLMSVPNDDFKDAVGAKCSHCPREVTKYCATCELFICGQCQDPHASLPSVFVPVKFMRGNDNCLVIMCEEHTTEAEYSCSDGKFVCTYCVNRAHADHTYRSLNEKERAWKTMLTERISSNTDYEKRLEEVKKEAQEGKTLLQDALKRRRMKCLVDFHASLCKQEKTILETFESRRKAYVSALKSISALKERASKVGAPFHLQRAKLKKIMDTVYLDFDGGIPGLAQALRVGDSSYRLGSLEPTHCSHNNCKHLKISIDPDVKAGPSMASVLSMTKEIAHFVEKVQEEKEDVSDEEDDIEDGENFTQQVEKMLTKINQELTRLINKAPLLKEPLMAGVQRQQGERASGSNQQQGEQEQVCQQFIEQIQQDLRGIQTTQDTIQRLIHEHQQQLERLHQQEEDNQDQEEEEEDGEHQGQQQQGEQQQGEQPGEPQGEPQGEQQGEQQQPVAQQQEEPMEQQQPEQPGQQQVEHPQPQPENILQEQDEEQPQQQPQQEPQQQPPEIQPAQEPMELNNQEQQHPEEQQVQQDEQHACPSNETSSVVTTAIKNTAKLCFEVKKMSRIHDRVLSKPFEMHGIQWQFSLKPKSHSRNGVSTKDLGVYITTELEDSAVDVRCQADVTITLKNREDSDDDVSHHFTKRLGHRWANKSKGTSALIKWGKVMDPAIGYIDNDSVLIGVDIVVKRDV